MPLINTGTPDASSSDFLDFLLKDNPQYKDIPGVATTVATTGPTQGQNPLETADQVSSFAHYTKLKQDLESQPNYQQAGTWDQLDPMTRSSLIKMGYQLKITPQEYLDAQKKGLVEGSAAPASEMGLGIGGFLGSLRHAVAKVVHPLTWAAGEVLKPVTDAANMALRA